MLIRSLLAALTLASAATAQAQFDVFPRDGQLYPRDAQNQATVRIAGNVDQVGWSDIVARLYRDGTLVATESQALSYSGGLAPFDLQPTIEAGLIHWAIELELQGGGSAQLLDRVDYLACGDVFLVTGQSNAAAPDYWSEGQTNARYRGPWVRSFGTGSTNPFEAQDDLSWYIADGETSNDKGSVGSWPLMIGDLIVDNLDVPVAILNGAVGGRPIDFFKRTDSNPQDLFSAYGRLLYRAEEAALREHVRAIFWYQGESDGANPGPYGKAFDNMMADWKEDYPSLEQVYLMQVRVGCGVTPHSNIHEIQRQIPQRHPEVQLMSTNGMPGHDSCHYLLEGYEALGLRLAKLMARDFYGYSFADTEVVPPNPTGAWISNPTGDEITIEFEPAGVQLVVDSNVGPDFHLLDNVDIVGATVVNGNQLVLDLSAPTTSASIRYSGHKTATRGWLSNAFGLTALSFLIPLQ